MGVRFWHLFPYPKKYDLILKTYIEANFHTFVRRLKSDSKGNLQGMSKLLDLSSVYFGFISVFVRFCTLFLYMFCSKIVAKLGSKFVTKPNNRIFKFWPQICCQLWLQIYCRLGLQSNPGNRIEQIGFFKSCRMVLISSPSVIILIRSEKTPSNTAELSKHNLIENETK